MVCVSSFTDEKTLIVSSKAELPSIVAGMFDVKTLEDFLKFFNIPSTNSQTISLYIKQNPVYRQCLGLDIDFAIDNKTGICISTKYMNVFHHCFSWLFLYYIRGAIHSGFIAHAIILFSIVKKLQTEGKKFKLNTNRFIRYVQSDFCF